MDDVPRPADTREHRRLQVSADALLRLEPPGTPEGAGKVVRGIARDLSLNGVRLSSQQVTREDHALMEAGGFHIHADLDVPYITGKLSARAVVVWAKLHEDSRTHQLSHVEMGLRWTELEGEFRSRLSYAIDLLSASSSEARPSQELRVKGIKLH